MGQVTDFPGSTTLDIPVTDVLDGEKARKCSAVLLLGWDEDDKLFVACSAPEYAQNILLLRLAERFLLDNFERQTGCTQ